MAPCVDKPQRLAFEAAFQKGRQLGCEGVHAEGSAWMPSSVHPAQQSPHHPHTTTAFMTAMRNLSLALILALLASTPEALACGGGGSGSYRKPARLGQHQHSQQTPASTNDTTTPPVAPQ
jgi:hypothetical protein